jgi:uncharacterized membrane protein HdeD (DUF308 family)
VKTDGSVKKEVEMPQEQTTRKTNWWLVAAGAVLVIFAIAAAGAPGMFLEFLTIWAGAGFIVSGIAGIASYMQIRKVMVGFGWQLFMSILDIILGILLIAHPFAFAAFIPWLLGCAFIVFGVFEACGSMPFAQLVPESRGLSIASGVLSIIVGICFIVWPESLSIWVAAFAFVRGFTLIIMGFTSRA